MGYQQPPTPVTIDNTAEISQWMEHPKKDIQSNIHDILLSAWQNTTKKSTYYGSKERKIWQTISSNTNQFGTIELCDQYFLKLTKKDIENSNYRRTGTGWGCDGTSNPGVTRRLDNPPKGIRNLVPRKPDNPLKRIWSLVPNETRNQLPRRLSVPT